MKKLLLIALLPLAGCAGNLQLLEQGKSHPGTWNAASKTLEATVDGTKYAGSFSQNASVGFGTGVSGTRFATGTAISSNGSGQAVMTSTDGKVIQCVFQAAMGRGQGQCEGMDGRRFVLIIGG
jgi:hypothetical protein